MFFNLGQLLGAKVAGYPRLASPSLSALGKGNLSLDLMSALDAIIVVKGKPPPGGMESACPKLHIQAPEKGRSDARGQMKMPGVLCS